MSSAPPAAAAAQPSRPPLTARSSLLFFFAGVGKSCLTIQFISEKFVYALPLFAPSPPHPLSPASGPSARSYRWPLGRHRFEQSAMSLSACGLRSVPFSLRLLCCSRWTQRRAASAAAHRPRAPTHMEAPFGRFVFREEYDPTLEDRYVLPLRLFRLGRF